MSDTVEVLNLFSPEEARIVTDKISDDAEDLYELITEAYLRGAHLVLGYASWDDYKQKEFGDLKLQLPREERQDKVHSLRERGLSTRAIAGMLGVHHSTVADDIAGVGNPTPDNVRPLIKGRDGKTYQPQAVASAMERELERQRAELLKRGQRVVDDQGTEHEVDHVEDLGNGDVVVHFTEEQDGVDSVQTAKETKLPVSKPDLGGGVSHPARYSDALVERFAEVLKGYRMVLDPFAGTGRIHELEEHDHITVGVELEPEWAALHDNTMVGDALALPFNDEEFDAICTSPTYGNRLADHHNASDPHLRRSYTHDLGRTLTEGNSGVMHWGPEYRDFHAEAWLEACRVLRYGGLFVLNIKDHIRGGVHQPVAAWHVATLIEIGLTYNAELSSGVPTRHLRQGENSGAGNCPTCGAEAHDADRVGQELVLVFNKTYPS